MKNCFLILVTLVSCTFGLFAQEAGKPLPSWKEGEMEIHHIYTGRGEGVFCILPDGTTLLIDPGDSGPHTDPRTTPGSPDASRQPGEWIARYISRLMENKKEKKIDYAFLTHFHDDHMGSVYKDSPKTAKGGDYFLSGLSEVYEYIPYAKMIDRDWPTYKYPKPLAGKAYTNYWSFIDWNMKQNGLKMERFVAGSNSQFVLVNNPQAYKGKFEIRNIVSSGEVWTGEGNQTKKHFPEVLPPGQSLDENKCSAGIRISYGDFDYFNGGDLSSRLPLNSDPWRDIETPVGKAVGPVEVCEANHHAWIDAMNENFLHSVQPQAIIMQVWHVTHLNLTVMNSMTNKGLNRNLQHIFPTRVPQLSKDYLGDEQIRKITGDGGHVVIKVALDGKSYTISLLSTEDESMRVKSVYGPITCLPNQEK